MNLNIPIWRSMIEQSDDTYPVLYQITRMCEDLRRYVQPSKFRDETIRELEEFKKELEAWQSTSPL